MKIRAICCLSLIMMIGSVAAAKTIQPDCGPIKESVTDWAKFHFDLSNTGYNPYESILSPATVGNLVLMWKHMTGGEITSPAVVNGVVYVGSYDDYSVYALNASTGCALWKYTTGNLIESSPAVVNGVVYFGSEDNNVYALDASTGAPLWR